MNVLITGGTGFIGRHLIDRLPNSYRITVLTRDARKAASTLPDKCTFITALEQCDLTQVDIVVNLAGEPIADKRWTESQKTRICESRWQITEQLSKAILQCPTPPSVFISGSAIGFYGRQDSAPIDEAFSDIHDEFTHEVCAKWEELALSAQSDNTRVCVIRTGVVLGKNEGALAKMALPFKLGVGGKIGSGQQYLSWIHIEDMVNAIVFLIENPNCQGPFNFTAPAPVTNEVFSRALASALHRPCLFTVPEFSMRLVMGEAADMVLYGQNVVPSKLCSAGFDFTYPNISSALGQIYG